MLKWMKEVTHLMQHLDEDIYSVKNLQGYLQQGIAFYLLTSLCLSSKPLNPRTLQDSYFLGPQNNAL